MKKKNFHGSSKLRVKLTADDGFIERPIYSIKGMTTEKDKGFNMIELIKNLFGISDKAITEDTNRMCEEIRNDIPGMREQGDLKDAFTRDEDGNIISPFRTKKKIF